MTDVLGGRFICSFGDIIDGFTVEFGSQYYTGLPIPATCEFSIPTWSASFTPQQAIGEFVTIFYYNENIAPPADNQWPVWSGLIRNVEVAAQGNGNYLYTITGEQSWSNFMTNTAGASGYPAESDVDRFYSIMQDGSSLAWDDLDSVTTWADVDEIYGFQTWASWATYIDKDYVGQVVGSLYDVIAYNQGESQAGALLETHMGDTRARVVAQLFEDKVSWFSYDAVVNRAAFPFALGTGDIRETSLNATHGIDEIFNQVTIDNGVDPVTAVIDVDSIQKHGLRKLVLNSQLVPADQLTVASAVLSTAADVRTSLDNFQIVVTEDYWDASRLITFLQELAEPLFLELTSIPDAVGGDQTVFLNGGTIYYASGELIFDCMVQSKLEVMPKEMWSQVDETITWATYPGSTIWADAD